MKIKHMLMALTALLLPSCADKKIEPTNEVEPIQYEKLETEVIEPPKEEIPTPMDDVVELKEDDVPPPENETSKESENVPIPVSSFSTKIYTKTKARMKNLRIVSDKLDGYVLKPNEEFSYNKVCGPFDKAHGFGKATVFINDEEVQGYGGGVCQVSSTLYNAVKDAGVEITERHNHSKDVYYVPRNEDATVSYGSLDFKFKNTNSYSLKLQTSVDNNNVNISVYKI